MKMAGEPCGVSTKKSIAPEKELMDKLEQLIKAVLNKDVSGVPSKKQGDCLSDEAMAILIENKCSPREEEKYSRHILSCHACADLLKNYILTAKAIDREGEREPSSWLLAKVNELVPAAENKSTVLDLVLELRDKFLELIETTGEFPAALRPAFALRDKAKNEHGTIHVVKTLGKFAVDVEIDKRISNTTDLVLRLTDKETNKKAEDVRVSLFHGKREIESVILENGKVKFEDITPESYKIMIMKEGNKIGEVNVSIRSKKQS